MQIIPYGRQEIQESDIEAVLEVLKSDFLTQGPAVPCFESLVKKYCSADYAIAVNSATSALHISLLALDVGQGDYVWTSPNSFVASSNAALFCGAKIDFVDVDPETFNLCPIALEEKLEVADKLGTLPRVVMPVHLGGQPCEMARIHSLSIKYGFHIVEDASHAIGARYPSSRVGSCEFSDITVFSFHPVKIITTGEGGVAVTQSEELYEKMNLLRSHGVTRNPNLFTRTPPGSWYYEQIELGFNYRMTDIQAALGSSQIARLDNYISRRNTIASEYQTTLSNLPVKVQKILNQYKSAYHLFIIRLQVDEILPRTHRKVFESLRANGIGVNLHYIPIHTQPFYQSLGFQWGDFPVAENYYSDAISLPIYPSLKPAQQIYIIETLREVLTS